MKALSFFSRGATKLRGKTLTELLTNISNFFALSLANDPENQLVKFGKNTDSGDFAPL
ncbi:hypothetical protein [Dyadobacter pollutisoli]|jgi:hypothetical protein|uniref:Uncharacterized protein n=1 Tax=Dyadobacter pollutisoli TaxID=2910158 RepID=A0A9E8NDH1_9BACT|nr:hypothetical protein [Dyadobacter pollutisoli]WAC12476.1 hypothetical protein ON006_00650 [Dyadobacter pollutisoli]